jgi:hypothetical protein
LAACASIATLQFVSSPALTRERCFNLELGYQFGTLF